MKVISYNHGGIRTETYKLEHHGKIYTVIRLYRIADDSLYSENISDERDIEIKDNEILEQIHLAIQEYTISLVISRRK